MALAYIEDRQKDRQTDWQADRLAGRQTGRQADKQTDRQMDTRAYSNSIICLLPAVHPQLTYSVMEALLLTQFKCSTNIQSKVTASISRLLYVIF